MPNENIVLKTGPGAGEELSPELIRLRDQAKIFASGAKSRRTREAYSKAWAQFEEWCRDHGVTSLPADPVLVAAFVTYLAEEGIRPTSIDLALVAISQAHKLSGHDSPTTSSAVRETLKGVRREVGTATRQVAPLLPEHIRRIVDTLGGDPIGLRDRALLLIGFAGAFRRSELVALNVSDIEEHPEGIKILLRRSKTDQEGQGRIVGIPFAEDPKLCPIRALRRWVDRSGITTGPIFRSVSRYGRVSDKTITGRSVARIIKRAVADAGYDPTHFSGHSLRSGLATAAAAAGKSERSIMATTGHRSEKMVRKYIREGSIFLDNAADGLL